MSGSEEMVPTDGVLLRKWFKPMSHINPVGKPHHRLGGMKVGKTNDDNS